MLIEFVAHSSVVYRRGAVNLLCDPWLLGTAFDDGWALLADPVFKPEDFAGITHIWFSHEHPDHFSPRSLGTVPKPLRSQITVMYHASDDGKIRDFCTELGFGAFIEMAGERPYELGEGFEVTCDRWKGSDDSWLLVRTPEGTALNLNDCQINRPTEAGSLRERLGPVDVLLTQFSVSSWDGNPEELDRRRAGARIMLERLAMQSRAFEAKHVIPFASFIWCCHEENLYMNEAIASVREAAEILVRETTAAPVVLYPGDRWILGTNHDSSSAISRYEDDTAALATREPMRSLPVAPTELSDIALRFQTRLNQGLSPLRRRLRAVKLNARHRLRVGQGRPAAWLSAIIQVLGLRVRPARLWLTDHEHALEFDLIKGLRQATHARTQCDIEISSAALAYAFRFLWGGESLFVNGRFREVYPEGRAPLFDYLWMASAMNHDAGARARPL